MLDTTPLRILIIGSSGSGKTTLARQLADMYQLAHIEMDRLHFGPDFQMCRVQDLRQAVRRRLDDAEISHPAG